MHTQDKLEFIEGVIEDLEEFGVGSDTPINGGDAVDYLNQMLDDMRELRAEFSEQRIQEVSEYATDVVLRPRERNTVLAALRFWQREGWRSGGIEADIASDGGTEPLTPAEIDALCERINQ